MNVQINQWQNLFFNALQDKNKREFYRQVLRFTIFNTPKMICTSLRIAAPPIAILGLPAWASRCAKARTNGDVEPCEMRANGDRSQAPRVADRVQLVRLRSFWRICSYSSLVTAPASRAFRRSFSSQPFDICVDCSTFTTVSPPQAQSPVATRRTTAARTICVLIIIVRLPCDVTARCRPASCACDRIPCRSLRPYRELP